MSPAKKKSAPASASSPSIFRSLFAGGGKSLLIGLLLAGVLAAGGYKIWQFVRGRVLSSEEYQLTPEKIQISPWPPPRWVQPDPRQEVFAQLRRRGPISIMDETLTAERITAAFEQNPWIAKVRKVAKKYPATVEVAVEYRQPVLMVRIDTPSSQIYYAVDADGISLPTEGCFDPVELRTYPCLVGVEKPPATIAGKRWGDSRVIGGAEIAAALLPVWEKLRFKQIVPRAHSLSAPVASPDATQSPQFGDYRFELVTQGDKHINWGKAPTDKNSPDASPAQKVKTLEDRASEYGSLDKCRDEIDLNRP